jgi:hypothetical protein
MRKKNKKFSMGKKVERSLTKRTTLLLGVEAFALGSNLLQQIGKAVDSLRGLYLPERKPPRELLGYELVRQAHGQGPVVLKVHLLDGLDGGSPPTTAAAGRNGPGYVASAAFDAYFRIKRDI